MLSLDVLLRNEKRLSEIRLPLYNVHGDKDRLCEVSGSRLLHEKASSEDKTLQVRARACDAISLYIG